jgi:hypothetical protein
MCKLRDDTMSQAGEITDFRTAVEIEWSKGKTMDDKEMFRPLKDLSGAEVRNDQGAAVRGDDCEHSYKREGHCPECGETVAAVRGEAVAAATDHLYGAVMNIPCTKTLSHFVVQSEFQAYKIGHRDARHAAADLIAAFSSSAHAADAPSDLATLIEPIFTSWDGCDFDGIDIGAALRADFKTFVFGKSRAADATSEPSEREKMLENALNLMLDEKADYMRLNKLGDPTCETTYRVAQRALNIVKSRATEAPSEPSEKHPAWSRMILYTDTIRGKQTNRDDLWAITSTELRELQAGIKSRAADALDSQPTDFASMLDDLPLHLDRQFYRAEDVKALFSGAKYAIVPVEPSKAMMDAMEECSDDWPHTTWRKAWKAAIDAIKPASSQPTEPTGYVRTSELKKLESKLVAGVGMMVQKQGGEGWTPIFSSSQPTDGEMPKLPAPYLRMLGMQRDLYTVEQMNFYRDTCVQVALNNERAASSQPTDGGVQS